MRTRRRTADRRRKIGPRKIKARMGTKIPAMRKIRKSRRPPNKNTRRSQNWLGSTRLESLSYLNRGSRT